MFHDQSLSILFSLRVFKAHWEVQYVCQVGLFSQRCYEEEEEKHALKIFTHHQTRRSILMAWEPVYISWVQNKSSFFVWIASHLLSVHPRFCSEMTNGRLSLFGFYSRSGAAPDGYRQNRTNFGNGRRPPSILILTQVQVLPVQWPTLKTSCDHSD